jgi:hypothetical protein
VLNASIESGYAAGSPAVYFTIRGKALTMLPFFGQYGVELERRAGFKLADFKL